MLKRLIVQNFILVESLDLVFHPNLVVLTGETGAGKSALIDALQVLLGARGERDFIRHNAKSATLVAEFEIAALPAVILWLETQGFLPEKKLKTECIIKRELYQSGRSKCWINHRTATLQQLRQLGQYLVTTHGQNAQYALTKAEQQLRLLDLFMQQESLCQTVKVAYHDWQKKQQQLQKAIHKRTQHETELAHIEQTLQTWDTLTQQQQTLGLSQKTWAEILAEYHRFAHVSHLLENTERVLRTLDGDHHYDRPFEKNSLAAIETAGTWLRDNLTYDPSLQPIVELLENATIQLQEVVVSLKRYTKHLDTDPAQCAALEQYINAFQAFAQKQHVTPTALAAHMQTLACRREALQAVMDLQPLHQAVTEAATHYWQSAQQLSDARTEAAHQLGNRVTALMHHLAMPHGIFSVALQPRAQPSEWGREEVCFFVTPHRHLPLKPLAKIASGGELSRISLALQVATSQVNPISTLVFDEIDAGMSGAVAEQVGQLLHQLSQEKQVFCITHSPQVAASGQQHWCVSKREHPLSAQIQTVVFELAPTARIDELARMLGGIALTPTIRAHAQEMLLRHHAFPVLSPL